MFRAIIQELAALIAISLFVATVCVWASVIIEIRTGLN